MSPYRAIQRDYISAIPPYCALWVLLVSQHGLLGAMAPLPLLSVSPLESMRSGGAIPLSDACTTRQKRVRYPPLRYYLERVLRDMGGISDWAAKPRNRGIPELRLTIPLGSAQRPLRGGISQLRNFRNACTPLTRAGKTINF